MGDRAALRPLAPARVDQPQRAATRQGSEVAGLDRADRLFGVADGEFRRRAILQLQASHGNAVVRSLVGPRVGAGSTSTGLQRQPKPDPGPKPTPDPKPGPTPGPTPGTGTTGPTVTPAPLSKPIAVGSPGYPKSISFTSAKGDIGLASVEVKGRVVMHGTAAFTATPPTKDASTWASGELESAVKAALTAAAPAQPTPAATPTTLSLSVGGQPLSVALSATADLNRGFRVFARIRGPTGKAAPTYTFGGVQFTGAASIDAEVVFTPKKAAKAPADPSIGEEYLSSVSFAGTAGDKGYGKGRNVAVAGDDAVAAMDKLTDPVKKDKAIDTPEKKRNFLAFMRPWFGNDAATIDFFSEIKLVDVPNKGVVFLHSDAKARLEAVQSEIGADAMPKNNGVAWSFRNLFDFSGAQNHANMHTLGLAVDYNAYANPMLADNRLIDLIQTVTGRSHHLELGEYSARRKLIKQMGDTTAGTDEDAKKKLDASKAVTDFFTTLETQVDALVKASDTFKSSLGTSATKLADLKAKYMAALKVKDKTAKASAIADIAKELPATLKPWFDSIATRETDAKTQATALGVTDLGTLGQKADLESKLKAMQAAAKSIGALKAKFDKAPKEPKLSKTERTQLVGHAAAIGATFDPAIAEANLGTDLDRLVKAAATAVGPVTADLALYAKKPAAGKSSVGDLKSLWNSMQRLRAALNDPRFVFLGAEGKALEAKDPSASQLAEKGYFNLATEAGKSEAFDLVFMKSMVKHGFELGAAWGTPDPMHFELIVKAPTAK